MPSLKTRNVFIDTQYFDATAWNFRSKVLKELIRLAQSGRAKVFLTSVTRREIAAHLERQVRHAANAIKALRDRDKCVILQNLEELPFYSIFDKFDKAAAIQQINKKFEDFLSACDATILDVNGVDPEHIFDSYFNHKPPFSEGRKKDEFPDAFAHAALEKWCKENKEQMYVVSDDSDWAKLCNGSKELFSIQKLEEFVSAAVADEQEELTNKVLALFVAHRTTIEQKIEKDFIESGFYLEDESGDVEDVRVLSLEIEDPLVIEVDETSATLTVPARVTYEADVSYDDYSRAGGYDNEEKRYLYLPTTETTVTEDSSFDAEVTIFYNPDNPDEFDCQVGVSEDFGITVQPTDWELK